MRISSVCPNRSILHDLIKLITPEKKSKNCEVPHAVFSTVNTEVPQYLGALNPRQGETQLSHVFEIYPYSCVTSKTIRKPRRKETHAHPLQLPPDTVRCSAQHHTRQLEAGAV